MKKNPSNAWPLYDLTHDVFVVLRTGKFDRKINLDLFCSNKGRCYRNLTNVKINFNKTVVLCVLCFCEIVGHFLFYKA